eukprot:m.104780 g.104780  ORF g.104780 m.104780 type:complete len:75 (+) comp13856_c0_seq3:464-688(+)
METLTAEVLKLVLEAVDEDQRNKYKGIHDVLKARILERKDTINCKDFLACPCKSEAESDFLNLFAEKFIEKQAP